MSACVLCERCVCATSPFTDFNTNCWHRSPPQKGKVIFIHSCLLHFWRSKRENKKEFKSYFSSRTSKPHRTFSHEEHQSGLFSAQTPIASRISLLKSNTAIDSVKKSRTHRAPQPQTHSMLFRYNRRVAYDSIFRFLPTSKSIECAQTHWLPPNRLNRDAFSVCLAIGRKIRTYLQ